NGLPPPQLPVVGVVMGDRRDAAQQILEQPGEQPIAKRPASGLHDGLIGCEPGAHVVNPLGRVVVSVAKLHPSVMIQLEMIVCVHEPRQHDRAIEIDDGIASLGSCADRQHGTPEPDRVMQVRRRYVCHDTGIYERGGRELHLRSLMAWITTTTGGLPHRRRNASTEWRYPSLLAERRGSRIAWTRNPACSSAHR